MACSYAQCTYRRVVAFVADGDGHAKRYLGDEVALLKQEGVTANTTWFQAQPITHLVVLGGQAATGALAEESTGLGDAKANLWMVCCSEPRISAPHQPCRRSSRSAWQAHRGPL